MNVSLRYDTKMGGSSSKETQNVENSGQVQNNIHINKTMEVHNAENSMLLGIICAIKVLEVVIFVYKSFRRGLKRKLEGSTRLSAGPPNTPAAIP